MIDVLVGSHFRDHPTQRVDAPSGAVFLVEVKPARSARRAPDPGRGWTVEVCAPGADSSEILVVGYQYRTRRGARRRARSLQRRIRRGDFR